MLYNCPSGKVELELNDEFDLHSFSFHFMVAWNIESLDLPVQGIEQRFAIRLIDIDCYAKGRRLKTTVM